MRVFLSVYPGFTLAIPMEAVASMMLYNQKTEKTVQYEPKSRCTFISLPWLFNMRDLAVPHGVIMRAWNSKENKVVLLTAEVKHVIEIPDKEFYPIPKSLGTTRFSAIFSGIKFSDNPVLLLNVEQLLQVIQNEQWVIDKTPSPPEPLPPAPGKTVEEPPPSPAVVSEPSPPAPSKVVEEPPIKEPLVEKQPVEEPPKSPAVASEASSLTFDKILEVCGVIEKPPTSPAETSEPPSLALAPQTSPQGEVSPLDEVIEVCEIVEEPPTSPAVTPEPSSLALNDVIEDIEVCDVIENIEVREDIELCEVIDESPTIPMETSEPLSPLDEILELCEVD